MEMFLCAIVRSYYGVDSLGEFGLVQSAYASRGTSLEMAASKQGNGCWF